MKPFLPCLALAALCLATGAHCEIVVGNSSPDTGPLAHLIHFYPSNADGDAIPLRIIAPGDVNPLASPHSIEYEPRENVIYVADFVGQAIRVYGAGAAGAPAPLRTLDSTFVGQVREVRIDTMHDELTAITRLSSVCTWPRLAQGNASPNRCIPWGGFPGATSQLNNPAGLALNQVRDEIVVGDYTAAAPNTNRILFYSRLADPNDSAPLRTIEGPATKLGSGTNVLIALDEASQTLFALVGAYAGEAVPSAHLLVFAADGTGNIAPLRTIEGATAGLALDQEYPSGLGYDPDSGRLLISIGRYDPNGRGRVVIHSKDGNGMPVAVIAGESPGFTAVPGTAAITYDRIFRNGFDR